MSTKDILSNAALIAGEEVHPQVEAIRELAAEIETSDPELLTIEETNILKIAKSHDDSVNLINIEDAIRAGSTREDGFPNLALASYRMSLEKEILYVTVQSDGSVRFRKLYEHNNKWEMQLPESTLPEVTNLTRFFYPREGSTQVPLVPLTLRQKDTDGVVLLFEVADWKLETIRALDPYLLRNVAGYIYEVLGTWNITDLELEVYQAGRKMGA